MVDRYGQKPVRWLALSALGMAVVLAARGAEPSSAAGPRATAALDGHCPVCIIEAEKWVPGKPEHQVAYDGKTYYFPGPDEKKMFLANPAKYVPALGGDCTVCYAKAGKRVPGSIQHSALYDRRLFLFPSAAEQKEFLRNAEKYGQVDLALEGNCAVCWVQMHKRVPGKPAFSAIHEGLRYQFPSEKELRMFQAAPAKFAAKTAGKDQPAAGSDSGATVSIKGKTACAACSHGVTPIGAKDTLGLAIETDDGKVYVVEDAHQRYPDIYNGRFDGLLVQASGTVIQQRGKFTWIRPTRLEMLR